MKPGIKPGNDLERILQIAHRSRENLPSGDHWPQAVMRRIRQLPAARPLAGWSFGTLVWRLAPATGVLALILLAVMLNVHLVADGDLFQLLYPEVQTTSLMDLLNFS